MTFKGILNGLGSGVLQGAGELISKFKADPTKVIEIEAEFEKLKISHEENIKKMELDLEQSYLKDMDSARQMQIEALKQGDTFSKRFVYYLAMGVILIVSGFDFCMFFVKYPIENRDMINMIAGILNSTALVMVLSFFFGSSAGSGDKQEKLNSLMNKMITK